MFRPNIAGWSGSVYNIERLVRSVKDFEDRCPENKRFSPLVNDNTIDNKCLLQEINDELIFGVPYSAILSVTNIIFYSTPPARGSGTHLTVSQR